MHYPNQIIRFVGVLFGLLWLTSSIAEITGIIPYSNEIPPLSERVKSALIPLFFAAVLLVPQRWFYTGRRFYFLFVAYLIVIGMITFYKGVDFYSTYSEVAGPIFLIFLITILSVFIANAVVLWLSWKSYKTPN